MASNRKLYAFEPVSHPVAPLPLYLRRQLRSLGIGGVFIAVAVVAGMVGPAWSVIIILWDLRGSTPMRMPP
jgi:hypothetical protein